MKLSTSRARALFEQAIEIASDEERGRFIREACGHDTDLLRRLLTLLEAHRQAASGFLPAEPEPDAAVGVADEAPGTMIGRYQLLQKLGEGGMGVVYKAEQQEPVRRKVALKIIKLGMDTRQVVARFEAERQALALMDHPNIARVFDAGAIGVPESQLSNPNSRLPVGRPYFVMELVEGIPITEFCAKNQLSVEQRLRLFIQVCQAVQHAHQKGIIHRDLKPSNVLVTLHDGAPAPKVIDFGVAKATNQPLTEKTLFTQHALLIGTPAYMSPEQARMTGVGIDTDTRSDVYSLGVLLYELLTGQTPFNSQELMASGFEEMCRIIREVEPDRPSTRLRLSQAQTARRPAHGRLAIHGSHSAIDSDLDWIVMKCLEKDRSRRYATANGLAADLERHLSHEPVVARPPTAIYRFRKLGRRYRTALTIATAGALILVLASVVSLRQANLARRAAQDARVQGETARAVKDFLVQELLGGANPFAVPVFDPNKRPTVERVAQELSGKFPNQPLVEAEIRYALGDAFDSLDLYPEAVIQWEKALAIRERHYGPEHPETVLTAARLAGAYFAIPERRSEAERLASKAVAAGRRVRPPQSLPLGLALGKQGYIFDQTGRHAEALVCAGEAAGILKQHRPGSDQDVAENLWTLASATEHLGRLEEAERAYDEGFRFCQSSRGTNYPMASAFLRSKGTVLQRRGLPEKSIPPLEQAIELQRRSLPPDHNWIAETEYYLASGFDKAGRSDEAAAHFAEAIARLVKHFPLLNARVFPLQAVRFLVLHSYTNLAAKAYEQIAEAVQAYPVREGWTFELLLGATAAVKGWPATAQLCREPPSDYVDPTEIWLNQAWVLRYLGDEDAYNSLAGKTLTFGASLTNLEAQVRLIGIASLGSCRFSAEQLWQLDGLIQKVEDSLPTAATNQQSKEDSWRRFSKGMFSPDDLQAQGYRAIARLLLQFGRAQACLSVLERSAANGSGKDPYCLLIRAACLHRLGRSEEAKATFNAADSIISGLLPEPVALNERFLTPCELYEQVLTRREVATLLASR